MKKEIKKSWCICMDVIGGPLNFGKIKKGNGSLDIRHSEKDNFDTVWDPKYVKRFDTLDELSTSIYNIKKTIWWAN